MDDAQNPNPSGVPTDGGNVEPTPGMDTPPGAPAPESPNVGDQPGAPATEVPPTSGDMPSAPTGGDTGTNQG